MFLARAASSSGEPFFTASFSVGAVLKKYLSNHATSSSTLRIWCVSLRGPCGSPGNTTNFTGTLPWYCSARKYDQLCAGGTFTSFVPWKISTGALILSILKNGDFFTYRSGSSNGDLPK